MVSFCQVALVSALSTISAVSGFVPKNHNDMFITRSVSANAPLNVATPLDKIAPEDTFDTKRVEPELPSSNGAKAAVVSVEHGRGQWESYGDLETFQPGMFQIKCFNKISPVGLGEFGEAKYDVRTEGTDGHNAHAILLRSHKLQMEDVPETTRAIARAGAGVNNIPVDKMTEMGIPVFNTPGANANAVKELVFCGMLIASRGIVSGINHMEKLGAEGKAKERVEKDKAMFGGREIKGKTLAVIGLGNIGAMTAHDAEVGLGMKTVGYDPYLTAENARKLPNGIVLCDSIKKAVAQADFISINVPYITGEGGTHGIINKDVIDSFKDDAVFLNFARGELVDSEAMKDFLDRGPASRYVSDFPDDLLWDHPNMIILPHLGASTEEAEDTAASMAANTLMDFLEKGTIRNSVNFPAVNLTDRDENTVRIVVISEDSCGALQNVVDLLADAKLNIVQEIMKTRGSICYTVLDLDATCNGECISFEQIQEKITMIPGVKSSRILYGEAGTGYAKNLSGEYFV